MFPRYLSVLFLLVLGMPWWMGYGRQNSPPPIGTIQGSGAVSPYLYDTVSFRGVVTGMYEDRNVAGTTYYTLFVQDLPGFEDGDPNTSDGIAVFIGRERPSAHIGDQVLVRGRVTEFYGLTEIDDDGLQLSVEQSGVPLPEPITVAPPADNFEQAAYFEPLEGMRVAIEGEAQVVGATFSGCSFAVVGPDVADVPIVRQSTAAPIGQIIPILHTSDVDCTGFPDVKTGDRVTGLVGPLIYHFDLFKLVQQEAGALRVTAVSPPPLPAPPVLAANQFSIATFNLEEYFDTADDTGTEAEPKLTADELTVKQSKLALQISELLGCPTLVGIQEAENEALLLALAEQLNPACGFTYTITHRDSADVRGIDVALLSDPRRTVVQDAILQPTCTALDTGITDATLTCPASQQPLFSRPPLQVDVEVDGRAHTLFINHFKSKRGGEAETAAERLAQAQHISTLVDGLLAADPQARIIVMGDFNDYELSPTLQEMTGNGRLSNPLAQIPLPQRYSFIFSGAAQLIDGILLSSTLADEVAFATIQHVNADFPDVLAADPTSPYHASDHDLPLIVLNGEQIVATAVPGPIPSPSPPPSPSFNWLWLVALGGLVLVGGTAVYLTRRISKQ